MTERAIVPLSAKPPLLAMAALLAASVAASAQERCTGTLCDAYYGSSAPAPSTPAGATPMTVPSGGILGFFSTPKTDPAGAPGTASDKAPLVAVGGGGLVGMVQGAPPERCSGTLCDMYYGGPAPEPQKAATGPAPRDAQGIDRSGETGIDRAAPPRARNRRAAAADEGSVSYAPRQVERPNCVAPPGDPWKCYRK